eukprot:TRINITY_DN23602_c0_g1_i1.p1 TRINITY_DN23602_c0_g1~~TRINITY_DN23602_c0_g1_i1.p1  ORF type:complete len:116 (-),score=17.80 TRINITY_DN23602_c0_g1_i1:256-603(-)
MMCSGWQRRTLPCLTRAALRVLSVANNTKLAFPGLSAQQRTPSGAAAHAAELMYFKSYPMTASYGGARTLASTERTSAAVARGTSPGRRSAQRCRNCAATSPACDVGWHCKRAAV